MADDKLMEYISKNLDKGVPEPIIKEKLAAAGYKSEDITYYISLSTKSNSHSSSHLWIIIPSIILIILFILILFWIFGNNKKDNYTNPNDLDIVWPSSLSECYSFPWNTSQLHCIYFITLKGGNKSTCERLDGATDELNDEVGDISDVASCLVRVAARTKDATICAEIGQISELQDICKQNSEFCMLEDTCLAQVAETSADPSLCNSLEGAYFKSCFFGAAIRTNDSTLCEEINETHLKEKCFGRIAVNTGDYELCEHYDSRWAVEDCILEIAAKFADYEQCNSFEGTRDKTNCFTEMAKIQKDVSFCYQLEYQNHQNECIYEVALKTSNVSLCYYFADNPSSYTRDECLLFMAKRYRDTSLCKDIKDSSKEQGCINQLKRANLD